MKYHKKTKCKILTRVSDANEKYINMKMLFERKILVCDLV